MTAKSIAVRLGANKAKTQVIVPVGRSVVVPVRGTDVLPVVVPAPAAFDAVRPRGRAHVKQYCGNSGLVQARDGL